MSAVLSSTSTVPLRSGRAMPVIGLGTWQLVEDTADTVSYALDIGYAMIDTACDYGSQAGIGEALERRKRREDVYVVAKVEEDDDAYLATRKYLDEMKLDHADLMLIHRPPPDGVGEQLWQGLVRAREEGLTRDIGVSNYTIEQIRELHDATGEWPVVNQIEWSPFGHSLQMLDFCREQGIVIQAYSPLTRSERLRDELLTAIAQRHGRTPAQILLRWNLQLGTVPLPKANRRKHLEENFGVFDFELPDSEMKALSALNEQYSALGMLAYA